MNKDKEDDTFHPIRAKKADTASFSRLHLKYFINGPNFTSARIGMQNFSLHYSYFSPIFF